MKLSYRGTPYEKNIVNPVLQSPEPSQPQPATVKKAPYPRHLAQTFPQNGLRYRGVSYRVPDYSPEDYLNLCPTLNFYTPPELPLTELEQQHQNNIRQNLERRIQAAQAVGNQMLVSLLQQEYRELSLVSPNGGVVE